MNNTKHVHYFYSNKLGYFNSLVIKEEQEYAYFKEPGICLCIINFKNKKQVLNMLQAQFYKINCM